MTELRLSYVKRLIQLDLYHAIKSARGLLFLLFFAIFWVWMLSKLSGGNAKWLANPEGSMIIGWLFDPSIARSLFTNRSPTLSAYFLLAVSTMPLFVLFAASDQTATDIGSKYLRFLLPRCQRIELFMGRFLGAVILVAFAYLSVTIAAAVMSSIIDPSQHTASLWQDAFLAAIMLFLYALPFIALMSLCSALVGSAGLSALLGLGSYAVVAVLISLMSINNPTVADMLAYLLPSASKTLVLKLQWSALFSTIGFTLIYTAIYGYFGWFIFNKRDI